MWLRGRIITYSTLRNWANLTLLHFLNGFAWCNYDLNKCMMSMCTKVPSLMDYRRNLTQEASIWEHARKYSATKAGVWNKVPGDTTTSLNPAPLRLDTQTTCTSLNSSGRQKPKWFWHLNPWTVETRHTNGYNEIAVNTFADNVTFQGGPQTSKLTGSTSFIDNRAACIFYQQEWHAERVGEFSLDHLQQKFMKPCNKRLKTFTAKRNDFYEPYKPKLRPTDTTNNSKNTRNAKVCHFTAWIWKQSTDATYGTIFHA